MKVGLSSAFNNLRDISLHPDYGALTGFTQNELQKYYATQIREVALYHKMSEEKLLKKMKDYYNGFCFDGQTFVYNPFSTVEFFINKEFDNFSFHSRTPEQLISFMKKMDIKGIRQRKPEVVK